jgi:preprotein translocase subunit SecY
MHTIKAIFGDSTLRNRIFFVTAILILTRVLAAIPIPGVSTENLAQFLQGNTFSSFLNIFAGGGISSFSIVLLGVGPYITASIIMQLLTVLVPRLKEMYQEEGDLGRRRFVQYGRLLTIPLAILQGFALITLLSRQGAIGALTETQLVQNIIIVTAGTVLMMWLGELMNERGIGNGVSLIIFAGIVSAVPQHVSQFLVTFDVSQIPMLVGLLVLTLIVIAGVVYVTEAERPVPVTYARQARMGQQSSLTQATYLPLRLNQAGVVPIIFAVSMLLFPQLIGQLFANIVSF